MPSAPQEIISSTAAATAPAGSYIRFFGVDQDPALPVLDDVGGKGINLCRIAAAKFPVPPGFVLTTAAYRLFVSANGLGDRIAAMAATIRSGDVDEIEKVSARIRQLFAENAMPPALATELRASYRRLKECGSERVAVRSSATAEDLPEASFAGQQDTYLNIRGEDAVLKAVQSCWGSLWTARAVAYRAKQGTAIEGLAMAVVVQQLVTAEISGVMFTANPVTGNHDDIIINATWGLGEAIVGGQVTPDTIVVAKASDQIKEVVISEKTVITSMTETGTAEIEITDDRRKARVLSDAQALELAGIGRHIEKYYGSPQDIEWAWSGGRFAMLQSRPIRGLDVLQEAEVARLEEIDRLAKLAGDKPTAWVIHNLAETLAAPTPLTWDVIAHFMSGDGGFGQMYRDFGYKPSAQVCQDGFLELICGRIYADPRRLSRLFWDAAPLEYELSEILADRNALERPPMKLNLKDSGQLLFVQLMKMPLMLWRCSRRSKKARAIAKERFDTQILPEYLKFVESAGQQELSQLSVDRLLAEFQRRRQIVMVDFANESLKPGFFGGLAQNELQTLLQQFMGEQAGADLTAQLTSGLDDDPTIEQNLLLYRVAQGQATMEQFLAKFGHRAVNEMELAQPRWRQEPEYIENMLSAYRMPGLTPPEHRHAEQIRVRHQLEADLPKVLAEYGASSQFERVQPLVVEAQALLPYREIGKFYLMMGYGLLRDIILELARRWNLGQDVFFLHVDELARYEAERATLKPLLAARKLRWQAFAKLVLSDVIDSTKLDTLGRPRPRQKIEGALQLKAQPIAPGVSTGPARIVFDPAKAGDMGTRYILVCPSTDPGWTPLFVNAAGLIVERGGVLSHGAIVARDFGIPAVVCENATQLITNGQRIEVNGTHGAINAV